MFIAPMLLNPVEPIPYVDESSLVELKLDGFRTILSNMAGTRIYSRHNNDVTKSFPELLEHKLPNGIILDGETIKADPDTGHPSFEDVMSRFHMRNTSKILRLANNNPVTFCAFDILYYRGKNVMSLPLLQRKELLEEVLPKDTRSMVKVSYMAGCNVAALFKACKERKLEGLVIKQNKPYLPGRRPRNNWDKVICYTKATVNITGIRKGRFGLITTYSDGSYAGVIELAVPISAKRIIYELAQKYGRNVGPNSYLPESIPCKVRYRSLTKKGLMRLAEFQDFDLSGPVPAKLSP